MTYADEELAISDMPVMLIDIDMGDEGVCGVSVDTPIFSEVDWITTVLPVAVTVSVASLEEVFICASPPAATLKASLSKARA